MIGLNKWYFFIDNEQTKKSFIKEVISQWPDIIMEHDDKFYLSKEALCVSKIDCIGKVHLKYRTTYNSKYMTAELYIPTFNVGKNIIAGIDDWADLEKYAMGMINKGDNKIMSNEVRELLNKYYKRESDEINRKHNESIKELRLGSKIGKAAIAFCKVINDTCKDRACHLSAENLLDMLYPGTVSDSYDEETVKSFVEIDSVYGRAMLDLDNKMRAIEAELSIADNYEQKRNILVRYNILAE